MRPYWIPFIIVAGCAALPAWDPQHPSADGPPPPALSSPAAGTRVDVSRPTFKWRLPRGESGAVIELCRDPACRRVLVTVEAHESFTPTRDLPSGVIYWRLFGKSANLAGKKSSEVRPLAIDTSVAWTGKYVELIMPASESTFGERLAPKLDSAVELYVRLLGVRPPPARIPILFYTTDDAYMRIHGRSAPTAHEVGFTVYPRTDSGGGGPIVGARTLGCHIKFGSHYGYGDDENAVGQVQEVVLHELAHAVQYTGIPLYADLPAWWVEGLSDLLASIALTEIWGEPLERQPLLSSRLRTIHGLRGLNKLVPLSQLLTFASGKTHDDDAQRVAALYSESFYLLLYLDEQLHEQFRHTLQTIASQSSLRGASAQLNALTGELGRFEREWLDALPRHRIFPWYSAGKYDGIRTTPVELLVDAPPAQFGGAIYVGPTVDDKPSIGSGDRIEATVEVRPGDEPSAGLLVATADRRFFVVCLDDRGQARAVELRSQQSLTVATGKFAKGLFGVGQVHRLSLVLGPERWTAGVDDVPVFELAAPASALRSWGVASVGGRNHFRGLHLVPATR